MALTKNPVLRDDTFRSQGPFVTDRDAGGGLPTPFDTATRPDGMTIRGVITKGAILLLLMAATFIYSWDAVLGSGAGGGSGGLPWILVGGIGGFIVSLVISFKPRMAPFLAPVFALLEGLLLGAISAYYEYQATFSNNIPSGYDGIVFQAALATVGVFAAMLMLYRTGLVKVTEKFRSIVTVAMLGIVLVYLASFALSFFGTTVPMIHEGGLIGIGFSVLVLGIASMMLLVDFDMIERGAAAGAPKHMEWYGAFALLVTIVWIYLEMLRLLSKLRSR
jgi:uncharacterized YccA/Bax inhibitor family protein